MQIQDNLRSSKCEQHSIDSYGNQVTIDLGDGLATIVVKPLY